MSKFDLNHVSEQYFDILTELGNIGAGNATTALAQLLGSKVDMKVPQVKLLDFKDVGAVMGGEEQIMTGIYLLVDGDISGSMMFLMNVESSHALAGKMMGTESDSSQSFTEMELSALKEIGNIITCAYLNSLSAMTNMKILPSVPDLTVDMAGAILSVPAIEFGTLGDRILLIQTQFTDDQTIDGYFILVPDLDSYDKIMSALGIN